MTAHAALICVAVGTVSDTSIGGASRESAAAAPPRKLRAAVPTRMANCASDNPIGPKQPVL
jgi:hypothetical protein